MELHQLYGVHKRGDAWLEATDVDIHYCDKRAMRSWLTDYEPDYDAYLVELDSLQASMADVAEYGDWYFYD